MMLNAIILALLAPLTVGLGLLIFKNIYLTFLLYHFLVCLMLPLVDLLLLKRYSLKQSLDYLGFKYFHKNFPPALLLGLILLGFTYCFFVIFNRQLLNPDQINALLTDWNLDRRQILPFLAMMIFANSFLEEVYWRGYLFRKFKARTVLPGVLALTAFFYSSYHFITTVNLFSLRYGIIFTLIIFGAGLTWGWLRHKTASIYLPLLTHLAVDLGIMLIYLRYIW